MEGDIIIFSNAEITKSAESDIIFGNGCIVHPKAKIYCDEGCELIFGDYNIIEENVEIIVKKGLDANGNVVGRKITVGNYNFFKAFSYVENTLIGDNNLISNKAQLFEAKVSSNNVLTPFVVLPQFSKIDDDGFIVLEKLIMKKNKNFCESEHHDMIKEIYTRIAEIAVKKQ